MRSGRARARGRVPQRFAHHAIHFQAHHTEFNVRLSTPQAVYEAMQRESHQQAHKRVEQALQRRVKKVTLELQDEATKWSLYTNRLKKVHIDAERETMAELRGFYVSEHLVWQEASRESAVPWKRCDELVELLDHVRMSRHGVLVAGKERLMHQVREVQ